ncbi:NUDIX hydrolase [Litorivivens sp.]|uniref:NUDIX hydrolase n=1 Tax=Litorivivens sp. TaxID=2020868 RepID=UPI00356548E0
MTGSDYQSFDGAKLALFCGDSILVYKRDQREDIPYPGLLDLPGGGREGSESPQSCVLRELNEEFSLVLSPEQLSKGQLYTIEFNGLQGYFFTANLAPAEQTKIRLGEEGQYWQFMPVTDFIRRADAISHLQKMVEAYWLRQQ